MQLWITYQNKYLLKQTYMKAKVIFRIIFIAILSTAFTSVSAQHHKAHHHSNKKGYKHSPHHRYAKMPRWGHSYKVAPKKAVIIAHSGRKYHYHSGIFYKPLKGNYVIAKAPVGIHVRTLPKGKIRFVHGGKERFYYYGTFYAKTTDNNEFITIAPPIGATVDALPEGYKEIEKKGITYYEFEGTYFAPKTMEKDEVWYEVVKEI